MKKGIAIVNRNAYNGEYILRMEEKSHEAT